MSYSHRFFLYAPFAVLLLLAAAAGAWWFTVERAFERHVQAMLGRDAIPGVTIRYGALSTGGFPFRLEAVFDDFRIGVATRNGPVTWRAEHFALHGLTYGRDQYIFEAAGHQTLSWGHGHRLDFEAGSLHASAIRDAGGLRQFDLDLVGFGSALFTAERLQFHVRRTAATLDAAMSADDVRLSPRLTGALGNRVQHAELDGTLTAPQGFDALRAGNADWQSAVENWRRHAGVLDVQQLHVDFAPVDMMGQGHVSLDAAHRPGGLIDFKIAGVADWLARNMPVKRHGFAGALRERAAKAGSNAAGKMGVVLGAENGVIYLGDEPIGMAEPVY